MRVLLVHPEDDLEAFAECPAWDLVVDLARAPVSTYEAWSRRARCRVISLFDLAEPGKDLFRVRELLQYGMNRLVDDQGLDWWDILSVPLVPNLLRLLQTQRVAAELGPVCELHATRTDWLCCAIGKAAGVPLKILEARNRIRLRRVRRYLGAMQRLNVSQFFQVIQDKFDQQHKVRRRLRRRGKGLTHPVVLLPSAYINVSRTAVEYAKVLPSEKFLLMCARRSAKVRELPANVCLDFLDSYFTGCDERELRRLRGLWIGTKSKLMDSSPEWRLAHEVGILNSMISQLEWGLAIRNAWNEVFESLDITACLSADDSNPYTRIPLMVGKKRGCAALACHHGALDYMMAIKTHHEDFYLAKNEMERDYLETVCQVIPERIVVGGPVSSAGPSYEDSQKSWLVFFSEPYSAWGWRTEEIYREILPRIAGLAKKLGLKAAIKIHPFESVKYHRRLLLRYLGSERAGEVNILEGTFSTASWNKVRVAITVQSTVGMECASRGIPIFFCQWLQNAHSGYLLQFARFSVGYMLKSVDEMDEIPELIETYDPRQPAGILSNKIDSYEFRSLLKNQPLREVVTL